MGKQFFKDFVAIKTALEKDKENEMYKLYSADNYTCYEALRKYLYSYQWCRSDKEKILLQTADSFKKGEEIAKEYDMQYNSYRSMSSRVSNRMYKELGANFKDVVLGNNKEAQRQLINFCIAHLNDYQIWNEYPEFLLSDIEKISQKQDVCVDDDLKIRRTDFVILKFLATFNTEAILKEVSLLDEKRLSVFFTILSDKKYFKERAEVLAVIQHFQKNITATSMQAETDLSSKDGVLISKKEYQEFLKFKQGGN